MIPELTPSQRAIFDPALRVLEAGPGTGKTRALTARFITEARESPRGVALISFTNAAVDEVKARTTHEPALRSAPHFWERRSDLAPLRRPQLAPPRPIVG